jgi:hypothetical protein
VAEALGVEPWHLLYPELDAGFVQDALPTEEKRRTVLSAFDRINAKRRAKLLDFCDELITAEEAEQNRPRAS